MSVVIGIVDNDVVYMGADSLTSIGGAVYKANIESEWNYKIHKLDNGLIVGLTGDVKSIDEILRQGVFDSFTDELNKKYLVNDVVPKLKKIYKDFDWLDENGIFPNSFLVGYKDKLYCIVDNGVVFKTNACAIGSGANTSYYSLMQKDKSPTERIKNAIDDCSKLQVYIGGLKLLIDTKQLKFILEK